MPECFEWVNISLPLFSYVGLLTGPYRETLTFFGEHSDPLCGPIGQKFDAFAKMAFKSTALWPLKVMDQFFGPLIVLLQVW